MGFVFSPSFSPAPFYRSFHRGAFHHLTYRLFRALIGACQPKLLSPLNTFHFILIGLRLSTLLEGTIVHSLRRWKTRLCWAEHIPWILARVSNCWLYIDTVSHCDYCANNNRPIMICKIIYYLYWSSVRCTFVRSSRIIHSSVFCRACMQIEVFIRYIETVTTVFTKWVDCTRKIMLLDFCGPH